MTRYFAVILFLFGYSFAFENNYKNYSGYQLVSLTPQNEAQLALLKDLEKKSQEELLNSIRFWQGPTFVNCSADILVSPTFRGNLLQTLRRQSIVFNTNINDVNTLLQKQRQSFFKGLRRSNWISTDIHNFNLEEYHTHKEINEFLENLSQNNPEFVECHVLGESFEGRSLKYVKIGYPAKQPKKAIFIDAGIHAREWIAPAVALYFINELATNKTFESILKKVDFYVLPCLNPDGYEYTIKKDRMWRKTRSGPRGSKHCYGTDANRNFPFFWGGTGVSLNPCHNEIYCGPKALSESETLSLARFISRNQRTIKAYVTLHSYGNYIIYPYGTSTLVQAHGSKDLKRVASKMSQAIYEANGETYLYGTALELLNYSASGASDDYAKFVGIKYSYTMELTDTKYGFLVPSSFIKPTAIGITRGLVVLAEEVFADKTERINNILKL